MLTLLAVAAVLAVLAAAKKPVAGPGQGQATVSVMGDAVTGTKSIAAEFGAYADIAHAQKNQDKIALIQGAGAGAAYGASKGGYIGAFVGGIVGTFVAAFQLATGERFHIPPFPYAVLGLPYRPDGTAWDSTSATLRVPSREHPLMTESLTVPLSLLVQAFGSQAAVSAARRAGVIAWRPHDFPTPFSELLYTLAPHLAAYERDYLTPDPRPFTVNGITYDFTKLERIDKLDEEAVSQFIVLGRKLAMLRELDLAADLETVVRGGEGAAWQVPASTVIMRSRSISWFWQKPGGFNFGKTPTEQQRNAARFKGMAIGTQTPLYYCSPNVADRCSPENVGGDPGQHYTPARAGFPGAWSLRPQPAPTSGVAGTQGSVIVRGGGLSRDTTRIPDPENAFAFRCWTHFGAQDTTSTEFADLFGSHAATYAALERGDLAWHPIANSEAVRERWMRREGSSLKTAQGPTWPIYWAWLHEPVRRDWRPFA